MLSEAVQGSTLVILPREGHTHDPDLTLGPLIAPDEPGLRPTGRISIPLDWSKLFERVGQLRENDQFFCTGSPHHSIDTQTDSALVANRSDESRVANKSATFL